ncbi:MAG: type II secretion system F family protein [Methylobacteriaceae bacterium]|nr:type II secretion system F family protein [Methylobacteriaceae bacterium]
MNAIVDALNNRQMLLGIFVAIAVVATILSLGMPLLQTDTFAKRMKSVSTERERIRQRERERLAARQSMSLRQEPKAYMKQVVESFSLSKWLGTDKAKSQLAMAGYRGPQAEIGFLFFRLVVPMTLFCAAMFYLLVLDDTDWPLLIKFGGAIFVSYIGIKVPELFLKNTISKRQASMRKAFPDAMDLLLICVESGMSIEHAFRKVSQEIGVQSVPLAEEFTLATAELAYLPDRRQAFENLGTRTGVESIQQIATVLIQAEKYGTPLGTALRVVAQESREMRMNTAEKKAHSLPPKLTVPMILFFLPVLFAVIITPAVIQVMALP